MVSSLFCCLCSILLVAGVAADIDVGPQNVAAIIGTPGVKVNCIANQTGTPRVQLREYVTTPTGDTISDGEVLLPGHPNFARYSLLVETVDRMYELTIEPTQLDDGGMYECRDANSFSRLYAQVVMIERAPNCTSTLPGNGIVTEGDYYTVECYVNFRASAGIAPYMHWTGSGSYQQTYISTNTTAWSGVQFNVNKSMDGRSFQCVTNFTSAGFGGSDDMASNIPTWQYVYQTNILFVQYGPQNVSYSPVLPSYEIGMVITCHADAVPLPSYKWTNLVTLEEFNSQSLTLTTGMVGSLQLRCQVVNSVSTANIFANITVNPITTPPTTPPPTTTTTVPAVSACDDITGRWEAERSPTSTIVLCLTVDHAENGLLRGLLQNDTNEPYLTELIGRTRNNEYDELGFAGIWPQRIGVSAYAAECHRCYGEETMHLNPISRSSDLTGYCAGGTVVNAPQFTFYRRPITYPCSASFADMQTHLHFANRGLKP